jgi:hypothetical protein
MAGIVDTLGSGFAPDVQVIPGLEAGPEVATIGLTAPCLQIDPEFKDLIPPLSQDEVEVLKESLSTQGCRDKLVVWKDHNVLLDGHHRYQICTELRLDFETNEIDLPSRADAKIWILKNQRGRRNLNESQRAMLALKLEAIYSEKARENMGTRIDLGQNLGQGEGGRSAEKAGKDMGVSHQTVTFAKKVVTKGIPALAKMVESGDIAVSAAAKVASLPQDAQEKTLQAIETQIKGGKKPKVVMAMSEIRQPAQETPRDDSDVCLEKFRKNLDANWKLLQGIESIQRPENLVEMLAVTEKVMARLREVETRCLDLSQIPADNCVIEVDYFKAFLMSLEPVSKGLKLRFEAEGVRAVAADLTGCIVAEAFLPRELFAKYEELGEIGLPDTKKLLGMVSSLTGDSLPGKKNLRLFIKPGNEESHSSKLLGISGQENFQYVLCKPEYIIDRVMPVISSSCQMVVDGKDLMTKLKSARVLDEVGKFLVSERGLEIVSQNADARGTQRPGCRVLTDGVADAKFNLKTLMAIRRTIEKSKDVTLGLGVSQPMTLDLAIDTIKIRYLIQGVQL